MGELFGALLPYLPGSIVDKILANLDPSDLFRLSQAAQGWSPTVMRRAVEAWHVRETAQLIGPLHARRVADCSCRIGLQSITEPSPSNTCRNALRLERSLHVRTVTIVVRTLAGRRNVFVLTSKPAFTGGVLTAVCVGDLCVLQRDIDGCNMREMLLMEVSLNRRLAHFDEPLAAYVNMLPPDRTVRIDEGLASHRSDVGLRPCLADSLSRYEEFEAPSRSIVVRRAGAEDITVGLETDRFYMSIGRRRR